jgi:predicted nuclease with TOPRIM domain
MDTKKIIKTAKAFEKLSQYRDPEAGGYRDPEAGDSNSLTNRVDDLESYLKSIIDPRLNKLEAENAELKKRLDQLIGRVNLKLK